MLLLIRAGVEADAEAATWDLFAGEQSFARVCGDCGAGIELQTTNFTSFADDGDGGRPGNVLASGRG
jgi:hypothetical protein